MINNCDLRHSGGTCREAQLLVLQVGGPECSNTELVQQRVNIRLTAFYSRYLYDSNVIAVTDMVNARQIHMLNRLQ